MDESLLGSADDSGLHFGEPHFDAARALLRWDQSDGFDCMSCTAELADSGWSWLPRVGEDKILFGSPYAIWEPQYR